MRLGAGSRLLAYGLPKPRLPWEVSPEMGFREWHRSGDVVLLWRLVLGAAGRQVRRVMVGRLAGTFGVCYHRPW